MEGGARKEYRINAKTRRHCEERFESLSEKIQRYKAKPNSNWRPTHVRNGNSEEQGIYNELLKTARLVRRLQFPDKKENALLKALASHIAKEIGHPFLPLAPKRDKIWLFQQFERIHKRDPKTGERNYVKPSHVKKDARGVVAWAVEMFGTYESAMEEWKKGSYFHSLGKYSKGVVTTDTIEQTARKAIIPLFGRYGYVTREELRLLHPDKYKPVEALRKRWHCTYNTLLKKMKIKPSGMSDYHRKAIGYCAELFTRAHIALRALRDDSIIEINPMRADGSKLMIHAPDTGKHHLEPDVAYGDGTQLKLIETKSGRVFPHTEAKRVLDDYEGELSLLDGEGLPVRLAEVHIHVPWKNLETGVRETFEAKKIKAYSSDDIDRDYVKNDAPRELRRAYRRFVDAPYRFINKTNIEGLIDMVDNLAEIVERQQYNQ